LKHVIQIALLYPLFSAVNFVLLPYSCTLHVIRSFMNVCMCKQAHLCITIRPRLVLYAHEYKLHGLS